MKGSEDKNKTEVVFGTSPKFFRLSSRRVDLYHLLRFLKIYKMHFQLAYRPVFLEFLFVSLLVKNSRDLNSSSVKYFTNWKCAYKKMLSIFRQIFLLKLIKSFTNMYDTFSWMRVSPGICHIFSYCNTSNWNFGGTNNKSDVYIYTHFP